MMKHVRTFVVACLVAMPFMVVAQTMINPVANCGQCGDPKDTHGKGNK
jgi:hypothetical protein